MQTEQQRLMKEMEISFEWKKNGECRKLEQSKIQSQLDFDMAKEAKKLDFEKEKWKKEVEMHEKQQNMDLTIAALNSSQPISDLDLLPINIYLLLHYLHYITARPSTTTAVRQPPLPTGHPHLHMRQWTTTMPGQPLQPPTGHHNHYLCLLQPSTTTTTTLGDCLPPLPINHITSCCTALSHSLAIPHQSSDQLTVGTQPNNQMIVNELNVPKLSLIPHVLKPVGTQPHNHNDLTDENSLNHNRPKSRQQRRMLLYMNQTADQLGLYNHSFSMLTLDKRKNFNASWLKLPPHKQLPRPYVLINRHNNPYLPIFMYQIHPFSSPTPVFHKLQKLIITLNKLANNRQNITTNYDMLDGIMKGIGFCQGYDL
ncbi:hypothetical protein O181_052927, partial [Austropuccinia psidii MF-1]|nr:hypothetical protein [Austropuccinia psidii MF-1]